MSSWLFKTLMLTSFVLGTIVLVVVAADKAVSVRKPEYEWVVYYDAQSRQPTYVVEVLTQDKLNGPHDREPRFHPCPTVEESARVDDADYLHTGYQKGHMIPAADCHWSKEWIHTCNSYANVVPQTKELNEGPWKYLEENVRSIADRPKVTVVVVTGPAWLADEDGDVIIRTIGRHRVYVPHVCWKAVMVTEADDRKWVSAWLLPNVHEPPKDFEDGRVTVDHIEELIGADLFNDLPDEVEAKLEATK